jgi:hypothetical protein
VPEIGVTRGRAGLVGGTSQFSTGMP